MFKLLLSLNLWLLFFINLFSHFLDKTLEAVDILTTMGGSPANHQCLAAAAVIPDPMLIEEDSD